MSPMRVSRRTSFVSALALLAAGLGTGLAALSPTVAEAATAGPSWCVGGDPTPCVAHLYVDGVEKFEGDPTYGHYFDFVTGDASPGFLFYLHINGTYQLPSGTSSTFKV